MSFGYAHASNEPDVRPSGARRVLGALSRRRWLVIGSALAALFGAIVFAHVAPPRYVAEARVLLEKDEAAPTARFVDGEIRLLVSRDLARRAIERLGPQNDSEFDTLPDGVGTLGRLGVWLGLVRDPAKLAPADRALEAYFDRLFVRSEADGRILRIEFAAKDPEFAARAANTIADLYLDIRREAEREKSRAALDASKRSADEARGRAAEAEAAVEAFRAQSGLFSGANNGEVARRRLAELTDRLFVARTAQAEAETKAELAREMLRQNRAGEIPSVAEDESIRRIEGRRAALRVQLAREAHRLAPSHPRVRALKSRLAGLDAEWRKAAARVARGLGDEARMATARVESLTRLAEEQKAILAASGPDEARLRALERAARSLDEQAEAAASKYREAVAREDKEALAGARIIESAVAPRFPSFPKPARIAVLATIGALIASAGAIAALELLRGRRRDPSPGDEAASPPAKEKDEDELVGRIEATRDGSRSVMVLFVGDRDERSREAAVTLARALSRRGRAILAAAETADESFDPLVSFEAGSRPPGFPDVAAGAATFSQAIQRDVDSRLHVILGGGVEGAGREPDYRPALDALARTYEFVVVASSRERALALAPSFDVALVASEESGADALRAELERAGVPDAFVLESGTGSGDLFAA